MAKTTGRIEKVFSKIPALMGQKLKYSQIDREEKSRDLKNALHLLKLSRVVFRVVHSDANGIPLGAEINERYFKTCFLDVGLVCRICGLSMVDIHNADDIILINSGALCEQFVAQHLLYSGSCYEAPSLYYWQRQQGSSNAEVDYLMSLTSHIIPVEVKAGKTGSLKSLQIFISEKNTPWP